MGLKSYNSMLIAILSILLHSTFKIVNAVILENIDVKYVSPDYVDMNTFNVTVGSKNNMTSVSAYIDVIKDVPNDVSFKVATTMRSLGQDTPTDLLFKSKLCDGMQGDILFDLAFKPFGITDCPPKKGTYEIHDQVFDLSKMSIPLTPGERMQVALELFTGEDTKIGEINAFILT